ncbi:hypothetical protein GEMRC1_003467 [Eukaryota sp. GEM-RC1]
MLPLSILTLSKGKNVSIELKNGDLYQGTLNESDIFMNIHLKEATFLSKDRQTSQKLPEIYLRGIGVKYIKFPDELIDDCVRQVEADKLSTRGNRGRGGRGGRRGRGRGRGFSRYHKKD